MNRTFAMCRVFNQKYTSMRPFFLLFILISGANMSVMSQSDDITVKCDPITGLCEIPDFDGKASPVEWKSDEEIIYIGDPMCSWCWGISPQLDALSRYGMDEGIPFSLVMGGLRPGGGQEWDEEFKDFLKHHWKEVSQRSGQPFGFDLFEREAFNYDTEPACRAVVTVRQFDPEKTRSFYELVQHYFYVKSKDPKQVEFYASICEALDIDFKQFSKLFDSAEMRKATQEDFARSREWGVRGFPTIIYRKGDELFLVANGYAEFPMMKQRINEIGS